MKILIVALIGFVTHYGSYHHGRTQANGEPFDMHALTLAHRTAPMGTVMRIEVIKTVSKGQPNYAGNVTHCTVTDRGPYGAYIYDEEGNRTRVQRMHRNKKGVWRVKHFKSKKWIYYDKKPGKYRGIADLSLGCARSLTDNAERPPNLKVKMTRVNK